MPFLDVDNDTTLERFLLQNECQQWRIPILAEKGGVKVFRSGAEVRVKGAKMPVNSGDRVLLFDPLPMACQQALLEKAKNDSSDYFYVSGKSRGEKYLAALMKARQTINIDPGRGLQAFIRALKKSPLIINPIRNVLAGSHAHPSGYLVIAIGLVTPERISYEDLEAAVISKSIQLDEALFLPRPIDKKGAAIPAQFIFRGCRIGSQPAYMMKLKEALGNRIQVVAPKHFYHVQVREEKPKGIAEYMSYSFMVTSPQQLKSKKAVVTAFIEASIKYGFQRIDGKPVPKELWDKWIPEQPNLKGEKPYLNKVRVPFSKQEENFPRVFRYIYNTDSLWREEKSVRLPKDTEKEKDRKDAVKEELSRLKPFKDTHPFPMFKRFGYQTMDEFMDGWNWNFRYDKRSQLLYFKPARHEYTVMQPITEIKSNELVLNFYPKTKEGEVIELLRESDKRFFATF